MTIGGWILVGFGIFVIFMFGGFLLIVCETAGAKVATVLISIALMLACIFGGFWYFDNTASGQRAMIDQKSNLGNGLNRTVTVYTANGDVIAEYTGFIDIEANDGGYIKFDFDGKRYMYYNCFVESIADISK